MAQSAPPFSPSPLLAPGVARGARSRDERGASGADLASGSLDGTQLGEEVEIVSLALESDLVAWLRAVGIGEGDRVVVLRRAAFGGPLHVRTRAGGEFAIHRTLARAVVVGRPSATKRPREGSAA